MLSLKDNIQKHEYNSLITECFSYADSFSLTRNGWFPNDSENDRIFELLKPNHIRTIKTNRWFCYRVPEGQEFEVLLFKTSPESMNIVLNEYNSLFYCEAIWKKPEDICFFKNEELIFGSVSHEKICYVYNQDDSFLNKIKTLGQWEVIPDKKEEQIKSS